MNAKLPGPLSGPNHHFALRPGSDRLVVFFSGTGKAPGKFDFWNVGREIDANVLFVNDEGNTWYQHGIKAFGATIDETLSNIKKWRKALGIKNTYLVGASMGGYGAVLFGALLNVRVIAFGFDSVLKLPTSQSERLINPSIQPLYPDLRPILAQSRAKVYVYAGEMETMDVVSALHISRLAHVSVQTLRGATHASAKFVHDHADLRLVFSAFLDSKPLPRMHACGKMCSMPSLVDLLHKAHLAHSEKSYELSPHDLSIRFETRPL
ncbi:alpha/beta hydrolase [Mesorhizobium sp. CN2-181]|uniref:alpha/beta hydrolase n=1 Tax=Mesorhizobium yinganensis TaxID=3157707 RepID=UPI0032B77D62